jgi:colanic acid/amylovoran biosynthesis glycosyltransferase
MNRHRVSLWLAPESPWVLHTTDLLGKLTERWIQTQVDAQSEFDARLLGLRIAPGAARHPSWFVASDRLHLCALYLAMLKSGGRGGDLLARMFRANPPALIHGHFGVVAANHRSLSRRLGAPLVASFYGYDASMDAFVGSVAWRSRYRRLFEDAGAILVEGPRMAERVAALGCRQEKLRIVRLPADAAGLHGIVRRAPDTFLAVAAGRFIGKKGFDTAIRAFAKALRGLDATLVMAGGGELESEYRSLARDESIAEQVVWRGALPFAEFMSQIGGASVALFPSRSAPNGDSEGGAPVTLIEAQWLGVPALVSHHDDLPFVAAPDGSIRLEAGDVDAWAEALRTLYESPRLLESMGDAGAAFARANHSPEGNARAREAIYAELMGRAHDPERSVSLA